MVMLLHKSEEKRILAGGLISKYGVEKVTRIWLMGTVTVSMVESQSSKYRLVANDGQTHPALRFYND